MSRILDQLKNARENKKTAPANHDIASLDTIIEHNTPRTPKGPNLKRLIIITCASMAGVVIATFIVLHLVARKGHSAHSRLPPTMQKTGAPGQKGFATTASLRTDWRNTAPKELAAKKADMLPVEIFSIESIDEGPTIEEIELETVKVEEGEGMSAAAAEVEVIEIEFIPLEGPEEAPAAFLEIETIEVSPVPPEMEAVEVVPVERPEEAPVGSPEIEVVELVPVPAERPEEVPPVTGLPGVVRPETPRIEIKVKKPGVRETPEAVAVEERAVEEAPHIEAPPSVVMEQQALDVKVPVALPKAPAAPSPRVKTVERIAAEMKHPAIVKVPEPPVATPPPPQLERGLTPAEERALPPEALEKREHFKRAVFYQKSGDLGKARDQYLEIIRLDPMDPETHNNLGSIYQEWGDLDNAVSEYRKALLIRPNYYKARNNLGVALYKKGNLQGALREFKVAAEANPRVYVLTMIMFEFQTADDSLIKWQINTCFVMIFH
ncbi:MAG: tetratricopeptide repeat protein [Candidatus Brocadiales bacterium]